MEIERRVLFERAAISGDFGGSAWDTGTRAALGCELVGVEGTVTVIKLGPLENPTRGGRSLPGVLG